MRGTLKFLIAVGSALIVAVLVRLFVLSVYTIEDNGLAPEFIAGDRVVVNRWSYGLRTGGQGLFQYGRLWRSHPEKGDIVAFEDPRDTSGKTILMCRIAALPGDTVHINKQIELVPSLKNCDDTDYYWMEPLGRGNKTSSLDFGFVAEERIIGRAVLIAFSHNNAFPFWNGYRSERMMLPK